MRRLRHSGGQAAVEVVALAPLVVMTAFAAYAVLASGRAESAAGAAAHAAAIASVQGRDARAGARAATADWPRERVAIVVRRAHVRVRVVPALPAPLDRLLTREASVRLP